MLYWLICDYQCGFLGIALDRNIILSFIITFLYRIFKYTQELSWWIRIQFKLSIWILFEKWLDYHMVIFIVLVSILQVFPTIIYLLFRLVLDPPVYPPCKTRELIWLLNFIIQVIICYSKSMMLRSKPSCIGQSKILFIPDEISQLGSNPNVFMYHIILV